MKPGYWLTLSVAAVAVLLTVAMFVLTDWDAPPIETVQTGFRGTGMQQVYNPSEVAANFDATEIPPPPWEYIELPEDEPRARDIYENVQVLGDLTEEHFSRLMAAITEWVSPEQGCAYCHNEENYASDEIYTKHVSRRMFQMTQAINVTWENHVGQVGVTCWTCHRGNNVPAYVWYDGGVESYMNAFIKLDERGPPIANMAGQNAPAPAVGVASLPSDPYSPYLTDAQQIRVIGDEALPHGNRSSIKQTEWTYGLMMHMATSLGVNCTYCHNSRAFGQWDQSLPQRTTAWYGIRMVRDLNNDYVTPLTDIHPPYRKGPMGDIAKVNCTTCHQEVYKPLYGYNMLKDYPNLDRITSDDPGAPAQELEMLRQAGAPLPLPVNVGVNRPRPINVEGATPDATGTTAPQPADAAGG